MLKKGHISNYPFFSLILFKSVPLLRSKKFVDIVHSQIFAKQSSHLSLSPNGIVSNVNCIFVVLNIHHYCLAHQVFNIYFVSDRPISFKEIRKLKKLIYESIKLLRNTLSMVRLM